MKFRPTAADIPAPPGMSQGSVIPLSAKIIITGFWVVLFPIYCHTYGLTNFLWFCDAALFLTVVGMWRESTLLISACAVGILVPQCLWLLDFALNALGIHFLSLTAYMFDARLPLFIRALSLFHGWLPPLLVWLLFRVGYDPRGLKVWTALAAALLLASYLFAPPAGAPLANPNAPLNINYVDGFNDRRPQSWINEKFYLVLWWGGLWLVAWLPTHFVLRKCFAVRAPLAFTKPSIRFLN